MPKDVHVFIPEGANSYDEVKDLELGECSGLSTWDQYTHQHPDGKEVGHQQERRCWAAGSDEGRRSL